MIHKWKMEVYQLNIYITCSVWHLWDLPWLLGKYVGMLSNRPQTPTQSRNLKVVHNWPTNWPGQVLEMLSHLKEIYVIKYKNKYKHSKIYVIKWDFLLFASLCPIRSVRRWVKHLFPLLIQSWDLFASLLALYILCLYILYFTSPRDPSHFCTSL